ncbi:hypothetical protein chiPu_0021064 [Chiloscyllium punctatum]|uniref:Ig-like domain-containing protein n=1 Tax=Chiloscyllium punctatum TaxID=137246 RepID=A0A401RMI5_CHIPU|nr:hypothetical protein [Chiloscyllium punctatum]
MAQNVFLVVFPTFVNVYNLPSLLILSGLCCADSVTQRPDAIALNEGDDALLFCNYTATTSNDPSLFWYRQHSSGLMEFLLKRSQYIGTTDRLPEDRFSSNFDHVNRTIQLNVLKTELTDSTVYYCALSPTDTRNVADPAQKLSESDCT